MDLAQANAIVDLVTRAGVMGLLLFALLGGQRKVWAWGHQLLELRADTDKRLQEVREETERRVAELAHQLAVWQELERHHRDAAERAIRLAERLTESMRHRQGAPP